MPPFNAKIHDMPPHVGDIVMQAFDGLVDNLRAKFRDTQILDDNVNHFQAPVADMGVPLSVMEQTIDVHYQADINAATVTEIEVAPHWHTGLTTAGPTQMASSGGATEQPSSSSWGRHPKSHMEPDLGINTQHPSEVWNEVAPHGHTGSTTAGPPQKAASGGTSVQPFSSSWNRPPKTNLEPDLGTNIQQPL